MNRKVSVRWQAGQDYSENQAGPFKLNCIVINNTSEGLELRVVAGLLLFAFFQMHPAIRCNFII